MALVAIKISEKGRKTLSIILVLINIIQIIFGLSLFVAGLHTTLTVGSLLYFLDRVQFEKIFRTLTMFGFVVMVIYAFGLRVCYICANPALHLHPGKTLAVWLLAGFITSFLGIAIAALAPISATTLLQQLRNSFFRGMGQYLSDSEWKTTFDILQQELGCCGTLSYTDWHRVSWINIDLLREDSQTVLRDSEVDGRVLPPVVPWSCCNPSVRFPCFHDKLQQSQSIKIWQDLVLDSLYTEGCLQVLRPSVQRAMDGAIGICVLIFLLQLAIAIIVRYLYTASRNSVIIGDPTVSAYGWLFGRGDCLYKSGLTMKELDEMRSQQKALIKRGKGAGKENKKKKKYKDLETYEEDTTNEEQERSKLLKWKKSSRKQNSEDKKFD